MEQLFDNWKYGGYPQNADFNDWNFEFDQWLITIRTIDH